jgi:hypothetical protein
MAANEANVTTASMANLDGDAWGGVHRAADAGPDSNVSYSDIYPRFEPDSNWPYGPHFDEQSIAVRESMTVASEDGGFSPMLSSFVSDHAALHANRC